ncbi:multisubunit sodium/proton antiporter, MrpF subunit [Pseudopedobacter saltans DSM 12145]|uniref:Multisubunit sodium/proton antiporter, MrpF subunit n=1 Tax=Pseudopedobacter saltans (strain ATCC 51119 / DSM 12145 / JCM 21818 / CCUG 39354 / LMG 10337 / NBRC 100064 / NCIMB 13643) TaxID=762903 RepID=F0SE83_PSESL|nr:cation:proton antiporter [Pseudopedobacter saltans]ADY54005.1 multisubunit sodium/proton antiporter, MrpF subunit [Pseudopedobacter saltans DSM 12145]
MNLSLYLQFVILPILSFSLILTFIRLMKGPSIVDRVIALDLIITSGIGVIAIYCITFNNSLFLDVGMILALIAFLGTLAFSYYIEKINK